MPTHEPILVLGASGYLGAHVVRRAVAAGEAVHAAGRTGPARGRDDRAAADAWSALGGDLAGTGASAGAWPALRRADLTLPGAAEDLFAAVRPNRVILAAALARAAPCERDPALAHALNVDVPRRIAALCAAHDARLVHVSTDLVFGARPPRARGAADHAGYREDDPPSPLSMYGATKAAGEEVVLASGARALVARLPLLYGDSFGRGLGATDQLFAQLAAGARPFLFTDEFRTPLAVEDAAAALLELAARDDTGVLHVAGPVRCQRAELAELALRARGMSAADVAAAIERGPRAARAMEERPGDVSLDASRARDLLDTRLRAPAEVLRARPA